MSAVEGGKMTDSIYPSGTTCQSTTNLVGKGHAFQIQRRHLLQRGLWGFPKPRKICWARDDSKGSNGEEVFGGLRTVDGNQKSGVQQLRER